MSGPACIRIVVAALASVALASCDFDGEYQKYCDTHEHCDGGMASGGGAATGGGGSAVSGGGGSSVGGGSATGGGGSAATGGGGSATGGGGGAATGGGGGAAATGGGGGGAATGGGGGGAATGGGGGGAATGGGGGAATGGGGGPLMFTVTPSTAYAGDPNACVPAKLDFTSALAMPDTVTATRPNEYLFLDPTCDGGLTHTVAVPAGVMSVNVFVRLGSFGSFAGQLLVDDAGLAQPFAVISEGIATWQGANTIRSDGGCSAPIDVALLGDQGNVWPVFDTTSFGVTLGPGVTSYTNASCSAAATLDFSTSNPFPLYLEATMPGPFTATAFGTGVAQGEIDAGQTTISAQ